MREIEEEKFQAMKVIVELYQTKYKPLEKIKLKPRDITNLRKKIQEKKVEGYTHLLRIITMYSQEQDEILELYVNKLYLEYLDLKED